MSSVDDLNRLLNVVVPFLAIGLMAGSMYYGIGVFDDSPIVYTNTTEHVVDKKFVQVDNFMNHRLHYYVFTDNHLFDLSLSEYNKVNINDSVVIESCNKDTSSVTGYFNGFSKGIID